MKAETTEQQIATMLKKKKNQLLQAWTHGLLTSQVMREELINAEELNRQAEVFLKELTVALTGDIFEDIEADEFNELKKTISDASSFFMNLGFSASESVMFVFSLKDSILSFLEDEFRNQPTDLIRAVLMTNRLLEKLGLYAFESFTRDREEIILQQQQDMIELSNPVIRVWEGIIALPIIGTLDSARTQIIMEGVLTKLVETNSVFAIIDISGVPTVDTLIAQYLIKTAKAIQLMGADCIVSGIRPEIAQTIVQMGIDISNVKSKATMEAALKSAFRSLGYSISRA